MTLLLNRAMSVQMTPQAQEDLAYWQQHDQAMASRVLSLLDNLQQGHTFPAQLATQLKFGKLSLLSLKLSTEHRLVVEPIGAEFIVHQCRFHY